MVKDIKDFLKEGIESIEFPLTCVDQLGKAATKAGMKLDWDEMETNGWEWDYWITAIYKKQKYTISGSGYYGWGKIEKYDQSN